MSDLMTRARIVAKSRAAMTSEDARILRRTVDRIFRWAGEEDCKRRKSGTLGIETRALAGALDRALSDVRENGSGLS
jgi:phage gpG-like protein